MKIGVPKEIQPGETRVALTPALVPLLLRDQHEILVETGAGWEAGFSDEQFRQAGATLTGNPAELYSQADIIFKVQPPRLGMLSGQMEMAGLREDAGYIGFLAPFNNLEIIETFAARRITAYALEFIPRLARTQNMDALSSMATIAGYKAVLIAAERSGKLFPLMMTAAGTIPPANILVLGAGVAGLQAIATAHRLGAKVEAFDPRPAVREQVKSLGAAFVEMELPKDIETAGGYAKEQSAEFIEKEMEAISARLPKADVVITTAQIFGKSAPRFITAEMVELLKPGSIIIDLAAEQGGNCALTRPGQTIEHKGVKIIGPVNLPATVPGAASQLYARNLFNLFRYLYPASGAPPDLSDEIVKACCVTHAGEVVNEELKKLVRQGVAL